MKQLLITSIMATTLASGSVLANPAAQQGDLDQIFAAPGKAGKVATLSHQEMVETEGEVLWFVPIAAWTIGGGALGVATNRWATGSWAGSGRAFGAGATAGFYNSNLPIRALGATGSYTMGAFGAASWYRF